MSQPKAPTPAAIARARAAAGLTYEQAAGLIYHSYRAWMQWEAGHRKMHPALWELWQAKLAGKL